MNGPQHFREAERLAQLAAGDSEVSIPGETWQDDSDILTAAQVHATLALAAAQLETVLPGTVADTAAKWQDAIT